MARKVVKGRTAPAAAKAAKKPASKASTGVKRVTAKPAAIAPAKTLKRSADKRPAMPDRRTVARDQRPDAERRGTGKLSTRSDKSATTGHTEKKRPAAKAETTPTAAKVLKPKKPRAKKAPPRMRVRWCIYDGMMKPVAMFDYNQKKEAEASLAQYLQKKPTYFLQLVKELLPVAPEAPAAG